jgi:methylmalonyl-CoA/ethylmalonyl-CoA epimerase
MTVLARCPSAAGQDAPLVTGVWRTHYDQPDATERALVTRPVLDHVAIGTRALADGWELFGRMLGGTWVYGGDSGFWWGQLAFGSGPKVELVTPTSSPDSAFLERFLTARGPGPHHLNFIVPDISATLHGVRALGIEPVGVDLGNENWKEGFLHPRDAYGIVIQVAQQSGRPPELAPPPDLPSPGPSCAFALVEHHVNDLAGALQLFSGVLAGVEVSQHDTGSGQAVELSWENGARLRLVEASPPAGRGEARSGAPGALYFVRDGQPFSPAEFGLVADLSARLGVSLELSS